MIFKREQQSTHPPKLSVSHLASSTPTYPLTMSSNGIFDFTGFTGFDNNNLGHDNSSTANDLFDAFNREGDIGLDLHTRQYASSSTQIDDWYLHPSNVGGPSQPYTGVGGVLDDHVIPNLSDPAKAPTTLYPTNRVSLGEGKSPIPPWTPSFRNSTTITGYNSHFYRGVTTPTFSSQPVATHPFPTYPNPDDLGPDFLTTAGPSALPAVHPSPSYEEREFLSHVYSNRHAHHP